MKISRAFTFGLLAVSCFHFVHAEDAATGSAQGGDLDDVNEFKHAENYENLMMERQKLHEHELEKVRASCLSESQIQLEAAEESIRKYQGLADQTTREMEDMKLVLEKELDMLKKQMADQKKQSTLELETLASKLSEMERLRKDLDSELKSARETISDSLEKLSNVETQLMGAYDELQELREQYINWQLLQRQYQTFVDGIVFFYRNRLLPFMDQAKETAIHTYQQIMIKYREVCVAVQPILEAMKKLWSDALVHADVAWQSFQIHSAPHVEKVRALLDEKAGPHVVIAAEKLRLVEKNCLSAMRESAIYPYILQAQASMEKVQKHIAGGLQQLAKVSLKRLGPYESPETLIRSITYVKENSMKVAIYLEGSIATLLVLLVLNSMIGGTGRAGRRQPSSHGSAVKLKVKKA